MLYDVNFYAIQKYDFLLDCISSDLSIPTFFFVIVDNINKSYHLFVHVFWKIWSKIAFLNRLLIIFNWIWSNIRRRNKIISRSNFLHFSAFVQMTVRLSSSTCCTEYSFPSLFWFLCSFDFISKLTCMSLRTTEKKMSGLWENISTLWQYLFLKLT